MSVRHCHGWRPQTLQLSDGSLPLPLDNPFSIFTLFPFSPLPHNFPSLDNPWPSLFLFTRPLSFPVVYSFYSSTQQPFAIFSQPHDNLSIFFIFTIFIFHWTTRKPFPCGGPALTLALTSAFKVRVIIVRAWDVSMIIVRALKVRMIIVGALKVRIVGPC